MGPLGALLSLLHFGIQTSKSPNGICSKSVWNNETLTVMHVTGWSLPSLGFKKHLFTLDSRGVNLVLWGFRQCELLGAVWLNEGNRKC